MSPRAIRRAAERAAAKLATKTNATAEQTMPAQPELDIPEPGKPFPSLAQLHANRANAQLSTGPVDTTASAQNRTTHGLARHNGAFKLAPNESAIGFEALKQNLLAEHNPATETEGILVNAMAESHWLANRAQSLTDSCFDPETGLISDPKTFALYLRYQTTHTRAFHKALNDLLKLKAERRKAQIGFEAQKLANERHEMKKQKHYWEVLRKDGEACHQIAQNTLHNLKAQDEHPGFEARFAADLAAHNLQKGDFQTATPAAA